VGRLKVDVAAQHIKEIAPNASVKTVAGDVTHINVAKDLLATDFIFSCTDSHGSRAMMQQIAYQYLIPCIDLGSVISAADNRVIGIHGRIQAITPGLPCLNCSGLIDPEQVRRDMMSEEERKRDPYITGATEPAPAVISINSTVASLAVTMFMAMVLGIPSDGRYLLYNAQRPSLRTASATRQPNCYICSPQGVLGRGDAVELFGRGD
jgi:molybdopterin/thiamine biosynthesis adenylyltransferase